MHVRWTAPAMLTMVLACGAPPPRPPVDASRRSEAPPPYHVVDATKAYLAYVDALPSLPASTRVATFHERVIDAHPELFAADVVGLDPTNKNAALDERLEKYIPSLGERAPGLRRLARQVESTLAQEDASFRRVFPDMTWSGTVYFTASVDAFDGALRFVVTNGRKAPALLFGIDKIVAIYGNDARIGPLFHHELFHCYHTELTPSLLPTDDSHGMLGPLWMEGLAVYVASRLTPDATLRELTLSEELVRQADTDLGRIAAEIRTQLDDTTEEAYRDFFLSAGKRIDLPKRVGYYVGLRVAKVVARRRGDDLRALARLAGPELRSEVDAALASLK